MPSSIPAPTSDEGAASLFAGTSGWAYPTWKPAFYPAGTGPKKMLPFYASQLNTVEVNFSFRQLPTTAQVSSWLEQSGPTLRLSFKAPQRITHFSRLRDCGAHVAALLQALAPAQDAGRLGLILFQLPPNFKANPALLAEFLSLPELTAPGAPRLAFEFRHESWFTDEIYPILRQHGAALCIAENDELQTPEVHTAPDFTAYRLRRAGGYEPHEIAAFAQRFLALTRDPAQPREVYAYFKHEDEPTGALNAVALRRAAAGLESA